MGITRTASVAACTLLVAVSLTGCARTTKAPESPVTSRPATSTPQPSASRRFPGKTPPGFPAGIIAPGSKISTGAIISTPQVNGYSVQMTSPDGLVAVTSAYSKKIRAAGYTIQSQGTATVGGKMRGFVTFRKGSNTGFVAVTADPKSPDGPSSVLIQYIVPR